MNDFHNRVNFVTHAPRSNVMKNGKISNDYGYFDEATGEYVITRPDTPTPWMNYLGQGYYGGIISNTAGGYSFERDPKNRRVTRYRYNAIPVDQPGRYVYLRDQEDGTYLEPHLAAYPRDGSWMYTSAAMDLGIPASPADIRESGPSCYILCRYLPVLTHHSRMMKMLRANFGCYTCAIPTGDRGSYAHSATVNSACGMQKPT